MANGELEKMMIYAYGDSEALENDGKQLAGSPIKVLINPDSFTEALKIKYADKDQGQGASGKQLKYEATEPADLSLEFLFDSTGIIDDQPRANISQDLTDFKQLLTAYNGENHEPPHLKLAWGTAFLFKCRIMDLSINYKLFSSDGQPLRAVAKAVFKKSVEEKKRAAEQKDNSPDLTHVRTVKAGDTLPLLCFDIYGEPGRYLQVAEANGLSNFRQLNPGTEIFFPPIK